MKKILILGLVSLNILFANNVNINIKRAAEPVKNYQMQNNNIKKKNSIKIDGVIINIRDYRDYYQYTIKDKNHGYIHIQLKNNIYQVDRKIRGYCGDKKYSEYIECNIY